MHSNNRQDNVHDKTAQSKKKEMQIHLIGTLQSSYVLNSPKKYLHPPAPKPHHAFILSILHLVGS